MSTSVSALPPSQIVAGADSLDILVTLLTNENQMPLIIAQMPWVSAT
jgi:hypothetical protein